MTHVHQDLGSPQPVDPAPSPASNPAKGIEWPTLGLIALCYGSFALATTVLPFVSLILSIALCTIAIGFHASLSHEVLHGHPFSNRHVNAALVFPAISLTVPYMRFRDTHLAHHVDSNITDPYDDPESNYCDPAVWAQMPKGQQTLMRWNNTLAGRMVIGPVLGQVSFMYADWQAIRAGDLRVLAGWLWHLPAVAVVLWWVIAVGQMPLWAYLASVYFGMSLLKIRTYLEHRAHVQSRGRTVIIEDRGPLALLFLNNNFHSVHHCHPSVPWYDLPALYAARKDRFVRMNEGYVYRSYGQIFRQYLWRAKDPVPHPIWPVERR